MSVNINRQSYKCAIDYILKVQLSRADNLRCKSIEVMNKAELNCGRIIPERSESESAEVEHNLITRDNIGTKISPTSGLNLLSV